jgi:hypothetical protein
MDAMDSELFGFRKYGYFVVGLFNRQRVHSVLGGRLPEPEETTTLNFNSYRWQQHCRGLYQTPIGRVISGIRQ